MPRTKIVVSAAALGDRKRPFHINVLATTTSSQVVAKVLQKLQSRDPPLRYQLWAASAERGECKAAAPFDAWTCRDAMQELGLWKKATQAVHFAVNFVFLRGMRGRGSGGVHTQLAV